MSNDGLTREDMENIIKNIRLKKNCEERKILIEESRNIIFNHTRLCNRIFSPSEDCSQSMRKYVAQFERLVTNYIKHCQ